MHTAPLAALIGASSRLWWRRLTHSLGTLASALLAGFAVAAVVSFWLLVWPEVKASVITVVAGNAAIRGTLFMSLILSYLVTCCLIRVMMLAFDYVSRDLRLLIAVAPLTSWQKAAVRVAPDWFASVIFAGCFASVGVFAYAAASPAFTFVEALVWVVALSNLVGCVAAVYEALLTRLLHDNEAARGGAAILTLVTVCIALGTVMHSITNLQTAETNVLARLGVRVLTWSAPVSTLVGFLLLVVCAGGWLLSSSLTAREVLRRFGRTPWIRSERGGFAALSVLSFLRNSSNRLGLLAVCVLTIFGIWLDRWLGLGVGSYVTLWTGCVYISAAAIGSYGDFVQLRWRVAVAPARGRVALAKWFAGHLAAAAGPIILLILVVNAAGWQPLAASLATSPDVVLLGVPVGVSAGLLAGCIVPYENEDMLVIATSGVLAAAMAAGGWLFCRWVSSSTATPALVWALFLLAAGAILSLLLRGPRHGEPQGLLARG